MGFSEATFYDWKKKFAGLGVTELRRLRQLEDENQRLKKLESGQGDAAGGTEATVLRPAQKCQAVHFLREAYRTGMRAADAEQDRLPLAESA